MMELLLASKSPRRRQLLSQLGYPVRFVDVDVDEVVPEGLPPEEIPSQLALLKAQAWPQTNLHSGQVLVTADTIVCHQGIVLGKPHNRHQAVEMLQSLSGDSHTVYTGVCLRSNTSQRLFTEHTQVFFKKLSHAEIEYYVDHFNCLDKAGAYGIQEWIGMVGVERIEGCFYNVMGLPLAHLFAELQLLNDTLPSQ